MHNAADQERTLERLNAAAWSLSIVWLLGLRAGVKYPNKSGQDTPESLSSEDAVSNVQSGFSHASTSVWHVAKTIRLKSHLRKCLENDVHAARAASRLTVLVNSSIVAPSRIALPKALVIFRQLV